MKEFLRKIKLTDDFYTELPVAKETFVRKLGSITEFSRLDSFDLNFPSSGNLVFRGTVDANGFRLQTKRRWFRRSAARPIATGSFKQDGNILKITGEISGFKKGYLLFYILFLLFYIVAVGLLIWQSQPFAIPFVFVHALLMFSLPYFFMRAGVKRMKYELDRDFFYLLKTES